MDGEGMSNETMLTILKGNLQILHVADDVFLTHCLAEAKRELEIQGALDDESDEFKDLQIQWAAFLYRHRANPSSGIPRHLVLMRNNFILHQKGQIENDL